jgi:hypothetical protein
VKTVEMQLRPEWGAPFVKVDVLTHEDFEVWLKRGEPIVIRYRRACREKSAAQWAIGDWLQGAASTLNTRNEGLGMFFDWLAGAANHYGYSVGTFQEFRRVARVFPLDARVPCLSWKHHQAVAAIAVEQDRDLWLFRARIEGWSKTKLQAEMAASREAGTTTPLPAAQPRAYLGRLTGNHAATLADLAKLTGLGPSQVKDLIVSNFLDEPAKVQEFVEAYKR